VVDHRPIVSVVMPFAGSDGDARRALAALGRIRLAPGDELVIADNTASGLVSAAAGSSLAAVRVVPTGAERSSYHARNCGAQAARGEWLLFIDSDCRPEPDIIERYFIRTPGPDEGALAGEIDGDTGQRSLTARYTVARGYMSQAHLVYDKNRPYAITANLLVRRAAWDSIGGFVEGVRSGGDTDFCWRLQAAGWRLGYRPAARVVHRNRESLAAFVGVMGRYAAGRAWLRRRYPGAFPDHPRPGPRAIASAVLASAQRLRRGEREQAAFSALDAVVVTVDLIYERLPNRPAGRRGRGARGLTRS
jgi:GT2 family glycosyltransferase